MSCKDRKQYAHDYYERRKMNNQTYYNRHKDEVLKKQKAYTAENRESILAKKREYYQKNKERIKQQIKNHRETHREEFLEYKRKYNATHATERNEKQKAYAVAHKEEIQKYFHGYYAKNAEEIKQAVLAWKTKTISELEIEIKKIFGDPLKCFLCGEIDPTVGIGACFHEKNRKNHDYHRVGEFKYILAHPQDFVPLCRGDHQMTHMLMRKGFTWNEIVKLIQEKRVGVV